VKDIDYEVIETNSVLCKTKPEEGRTVLQTCSEEFNILRNTVFVGYQNVRG